METPSGEIPGPRRVRVVVRKAIRHRLGESDPSRDFAGVDQELGLGQHRRGKLERRRSGLREPLIEGFDTAARKEVSRCSGDDFSRDAKIT
jgi:hypothetical protein